MDTGDVVFLALGVVVVGIVGRLLIYSGSQYLDTGDSEDSGRGSGSMAVLVAVVFHLVTLGLLALVAVLPVGNTEAHTFLIRLGILLIVLGVVYAATLGILARGREEAVAEAALADKRTGHRRHGGYGGFPDSDYPSTSITGADYPGYHDTSGTALGPPDSTRSY